MEMFIIYKVVQKLVQKLVILNFPKKCFCPVIQIKEQSRQINIETYGSAYAWFFFWRRLHHIAELIISNWVCRFKRKELNDLPS